MSRPAVVQRSSDVPLAAEVVWARVTTMEGVRHELMPLLSMTMPPGLRGRTLADADHVVGKPLGKSWLLLFGVLPVDYDDMSLVSVGDLEFHERSSMALLSPWEHERVISPLGPDRCRVVDTLTFTPRLGLLRPLAVRIVGLLFAHRHRRLARWAASAE